ncbi:MAG: insulinase family protein [Acidobacteriota bacterium]
MGDLKARKFRQAAPQAAGPRPARRPRQENSGAGPSLRRRPLHRYADEERFACYILNAILGGGMSSRLFQNIREKQGLVYSVYSDLAMYRDAGCMVIYAGTSAKSAERVVKSIAHELHEAAASKVSSEELRRAKDHLKGSIVLGLESTSSRMANLARQETYFGSFMSMDEMLNRVERVTAEEVQVLAQRFFQPKQMAVAMLGPLGDFRIRRQDLQ